MNKFDFSIQGAIEKRVQEEDLFDWATTPVKEEPFDVMKRELSSGVWKRAPYKTFLHSIIA